MKRPAPLTPSVPGRAPRSTSPLVEELESHCSPKGELSAKLTEGVNGISADPLRPAARSTSPLGEELQSQLLPQGGAPTEGL